MAARPPPLPSRKDRRTDCPAAQPGPEQGAAALGRRTEIERLYARHNPAKLGPELENLIAKYGERRLLAMARKKYGVQGGSHAAAAAPAAPPPSTAVASAPPEAEAEAVAPVEAETPSTAAAAAAARSVLRAQLAEEAELAAELSACRGR
jgi:transcriptional accessory protein Tex/SPT6